MPVTFQLEALRQAGLTGDLKISRGEAMALLAESTYPERMRILAGILRDPHEPARIRAAAAAALGRIHDLSVESWLLRGLHDGDLTVESQVLRSLSQVGSPRSVPALEAIVEPGDDRRAGLARFALTVIAHRHRIRCPDWYQADRIGTLEIAEKEVRNAKLVPLDMAEFLVLETGLRKWSFGMEYDLASFRRLSCAGQSHVICLSKEATRPQNAGLMLESRMFSGVAMRRSEETDEYLPSHVILTQPAGVPGELRVFAFRSSGKPGLIGSAWVRDGGVEFRLRSVAQPGALAVAVEGVVSGARLEITRAAAGSTRLDAIAPMRSAEPPIASPGVPAS